MNRYDFFKKGKSKFKLKKCFLSKTTVMLKGKYE